MSLFLDNEKVEWKTNEPDNIYESAILGRNILTVDQEGTKVTLWWLALDDDLRRRHRRAPNTLISATKAWLDHYQGIPFNEPLHYLRPRRKGQAEF